MSEDSMSEQAKAPSGANAPYKILKEGGKWVVKNNIGETKISYPATDDGRKKALAYMAALYRNVPGAAKRADKVPFTGTAKQRIKAAERRAAIAQAVAVDPQITRHDFQSNVDNRCLTCKQIQAHPLHGVDTDGVPALADKLAADTVRRNALPSVGPVMRAEEETGEQSVTQAQAAMLAQGVDAGVDSALTLLRSTPDLPPYAAQAQAVLQGIEPACDELLEFFGVPDADDEAGQEQDQATQDTLAQQAAHTPVAVVHERDLVPQPAELPELPATKAFLTEVHGRTLLTAPAATFTPSWEKALTPNEHMLWMQGRFVGAEKANRNGAFWSTEDLEMGEPTVKHGPLNWLHEARHVIGTIADAKLVVPDLETAAGDSSAIAEPHIAAMAAVWRWIYPDEAFVMEEASDQGKLWYSMECVSREVACTGDAGCGKSFPYMDVIKASLNVCEHIKQRSSTRHFVDPTFLGGAVIVPPVKPGWADADARVLREAASLAERSYEQACPVNTSATEWEGLMAQVVAYASR